jgi:hypothetical protein
MDCNLPLPKPEVNLMLVDHSTVLLLQTENCLTSRETLAKGFVIELELGTLKSNDYMQT